jgi:hypothetical protein
LTVVLDAPFEIQAVWDRIYQSRPYTRWSASGYRELRFYTAEDRKRPKVILMLNVSEEAHLEDKTADDGYRCPDLNEYLEPFLQWEYEHRTVKSLPRSGD